MIVEHLPPARIREWVVFFCDGGRYSWWDVFTRKGMRHIVIAGCDAGRRLWVVIDPGRQAMQFEIFGWGDPAIDRRLGELLRASDYTYLRVKAGDERQRMPAMFGCVGAAKALLGLNSRALRPSGLFRDLVRHGAEIVRVEPEVARELSETGPDSGARGRSCDGSTAGRDGSARGERPDHIDTEATRRRAINAH